MPSHKAWTALSSGQFASRWALICVLGAIALGVSGCKKKVVRAAPPPFPAPSADAAPANPSTEGSVQPQPKSETPGESAPVPSPPTLVVPPPKTAPPKPVPIKPAPPQISPRLSPGEQAAAERQTLEDVHTAERNLQTAYGKQLNASQHDLVEKIRGFLGQAREAMRASDWVRARNLAQKALVLSVELMNSLR